MKVIDDESETFGDTSISFILDYLFWQFIVQIYKTLNFLTTLKLMVIDDWWVISRAQSMQGKERFFCSISWKTHGISRPGIWRLALPRASLCSGNPIITITYSVRILKRQLLLWSSINSGAEGEELAEANKFLCKCTCSVTECRVLSLMSENWSMSRFLGGLYWMRELRDWHT